MSRSHIIYCWNNKVMMENYRDYVFQFLQEKGVQHAFMLPGGGAMHLDDSIGRSGIQYICTLHEQAAAVAAEAYAQHTNRIGVCLRPPDRELPNAITGVTADRLILHRCSSYPDRQTF